jgi:Na+-transporting methylmalonyl-CoA/oxaloacetate decarboxylase gamma subunit
MLASTLATLPLSDLLPIGTPALPLDEAGKYVAGAYLVFLVLLVVYVAIMAAKVQRIERELRELATFAETRAAADQAAPGRGEPAVTSSASRPGATGGGGA